VNELSNVDVIICTPGSSLMIPYVKSFLATIEELTKRGITWGFSSEYSSHVADAREITASGTLKNDINNSKPFEGKVNYKKLFWIDSDIAWSVDDFMKLYESEEDIVSGAYLLANGEVTAYPQKLGKALTYTQVLEMKEPIKVHGVGFGFLAVKTGVFESLTRPWFQSVPVTMTDANTSEKYTFPIMGEDISWCERVHNAGFDIWFDPQVRVTHHKMMKLTWEGIRP
jgi:hypothetical protein